MYSLVQRFDLQKFPTYKRLCIPKVRANPCQITLLCKASAGLLVLGMLDPLKHSGSEASDPREPIEDPDPVGRDLLFASFPSGRAPHRRLASTPTPVGEGGDFSSIPLIYTGQFVWPSCLCTDGRERKHYEEEN
jgi:hypothetical protein